MAPSKSCATFLCAALLSSGCATTPPPVVRQEVTTVTVPVAVRCIAPDDIMDPPRSSMPQQGDVRSLAAAAAADLLALDQYVERALAMLRGCAALPPPKKD